MFVCSNDYLTLIRDHVSDMVTDANAVPRVRAESFAHDEITSYLLPEYDAHQAFSFKTFSLDTGATYAKGSLVITTGGLAYLALDDDAPGADLDNPLWLNTDSPAAGVWTEDLAYTKGTIVAAPATLIRYLVVQNAPAGTELTDTDYFWLMRADLLVMIYLDIAIYHYHGRVGSSQVPQLRIDRYLDAIEKLKRIRRGEMVISIPRADQDADGLPDTGENIAIWSNPKRDNAW